MLWVSFPHLSEEQAALSLSVVFIRQPPDTDLWPLNYSKIETFAGEKLGPKQMLSGNKSSFNHELLSFKSNAELHYSYFNHN
jgi:hypothetical protein